jgi:hypothetical protein
MFVLDDPYSFDTANFNMIDPTITILVQFSQMGRVLIFDFDSTIKNLNEDISESTSKVLNVIAISNIKTFIVTGNGNRILIRESILGAMESETQALQSVLQSNTFFNTLENETKKEEFEEVIKDDDGSKYFLIDDNQSNIDVLMKSLVEREVPFIIRVPLSMTNSVAKYNSGELPCIDPHLELVMIFFERNNKILNIFIPISTCRP